MTSNVPGPLTLWGDILAFDLSAYPDFYIKNKKASILFKPLLYFTLCLVAVLILSEIFAMIEVAA